MTLYVAPPLVCGQALSQFVTIMAVLPVNFVPWFGGSTPQTFLAEMRDAVR